MITETTINFYPIIKYIGCFVITGIALFLLHNLGGLKIFTQNNKTFLNKFPSVPPGFYSKSWREQMAENNQELHELRKMLEELKERVNNG